MKTFPCIKLLKGKLFVIELPEKPVEPPQYIDFKNGPDEALKRMEIGGDVFGYERKLKAYESARSAAIEKAVEVENPEIIKSLLTLMPVTGFLFPLELKEGEEVRWPGTWDKKFQYGSSKKYYHDPDWIDCTEQQYNSVKSIPDSRVRTVARLIAPEPFKTNQEEEDHLKQFTEKPLLDAIHSDTEGPETKIDIVGAIVRRVIETIPVDKANFEHIAQTGKINGSLYESLKRILRPLIENN